MLLFLVQHGAATSEEEDPERPLTDRGVADVRWVVGAATDAGLVAVDRVVHSGKTRARQTAEVWGEALAVGVDEADGLAPLDDPTIWAARLARADGPERSMLVGHLPHLARLAGLLLIGDPEREPVAFRPGGLVGLEAAAGGWSVWLVLPPAPA
jgi:phosphohistidine phosphatase